MKSLFSFFPMEFPPKGTLFFQTAAQSTLLEQTKIVFMGKLVPYVWEWTLLSYTFLKNWNSSSIAQAGGLRFYKIDRYLGA